MDITTQQWFIAGAAVVISFFFGSSGIFQKGVDFLIGKSKEKTDREAANVKEKAEREANELDKRAKQIEELSKEVLELHGITSELKIELAKATTYMQTLLAYMEAFMPEGSAKFVQEMAKEIRGNKTKKD
jgi:molecular chaperone GrpE (heat shock protein)